MTRLKFAAALLLGGWVLLEAVGLAYQVVVDVVAR